MAITLRQISERAGVSMKTVSRVINNEAYVSEEKRLRVLKIIEAEGYVPHVQAQRLASGRTRSIALHYPLTDPGLISNPIELNFVTGVATGAGEADYFFGLITEKFTPKRLLRFCRGNQADGLIIMQIALHDWRSDLLRANDYPFVMIGRREDNEGLSFIDLDFEAAVMAVYTHLVSLGHERIGFLTYPENWARDGLGPARRARQGFEDAIQKFNLPPLYRECELMPDSVYRVTKSLLQDEPRVTAFIVVHNTIAAGALRALQDLGRAVPRDCSVIGIAFGYEAELTTPPLTAINWNGHQIGQQAAQMLIHQLNQDDLPREHILVAPELTERGSTARRE
jgi:DNA-binding LacI/PurR family transcriptional regulator